MFFQGEMDYIEITPNDPKLLTVSSISRLFYYLKMNHNPWKQRNKAILILKMTRNSESSQSQFNFL